MIPRSIDIGRAIAPGKTLALMGPRRTGKTTLLRHFLSQCGKRQVLYNGDNLLDQQAFSVPDASRLGAAVKGYEILAIDEAQNIPEIGRCLKIINDAFPELAVVATGSSSFELAGQIGAPLAGRSRSAFLYPFWLKEICDSEAAAPPEQTWRRIMEQVLIFGQYPQSYLADNDAEREDFLAELVNSLLLRDILAFQEVKGSRPLHQILILLAYQVGSEVSLSEVGSQLGINKATVGRYLDLLEKAYVIFRLGGFSRNMRSEVTRTAKYYFYDTGVRNALINNFNPLSLRDDLGRLWENYAIVERMKARDYGGLRASQYFWRTWQQSEIDLIEDAKGRLSPYEFKWQPGKRNKTPGEWLRSYPEARPLTVVGPDSFLGFAFLE